MQRVLFSLFSFLLSIHVVATETATVYMEDEKFSDAKILGVTDGKIALRTKYMPPEGHEFDRKKVKYIDFSGEGLKHKGVVLKNG